jgi:beta-galactosidase
VTVTVADRNGLMVPRSKNRLRFSITGPAEIIAVDNGDATNLESFQSPERNAYNGLCLVIVRAKAGQGGQIKLKAQADGLTGAELLISSRTVR